MFQFDLVCGREYLASLSQSLLIVGQGLGVLISTPLSDRFGRKVVLVSANLGMLLAGLVIAASPDIMVFVAVKFLVGAFQQVCFSFFVH